MELGLLHADASQTTKDFQTISRTSENTTELQPFYFNGNLRMDGSFLAVIFRDRILKVN